MEDWPAFAGVAALALLCDRVFVWMEGRGWIYWRRPGPDPSAPGAGPGLPRGTPSPPPPERERVTRRSRRPRRRWGGRLRPRA
jgi:hypothetical protein